MVFINDLLADNQAVNQQAERPAASDKGHYPSRFRFDLEAGYGYLRKHLVGQDAVCQSLCEALAVVKADIADPARPLWSALLAGPTGVGKTSSVKLMSKVLTGSADAYCRIDMNTLSQSHYAAALSGAPPGYVGSKEGVSLFHEAAIKGDFSTPGIVLFDEVEKASDEVILALLNVLEEGKLTLTGSGKTLDFRNTLIFFTTNLGSREAAMNASFLRRLTERSAKSSVRAAVESFFAPEFFNRLDAVLEYQPLSATSAEKILQIELQHLNQRLAKKSLRLTLTVSACDQLLARGFNRRYGARAVRRIVRETIEAPLAQFLFSSSFAPSAGSAVTDVQGDWSGGRLRFFVTP